MIVCEALSRFLLSGIFPKAQQHMFCIRIGCSLKVPQAAILQKLRRTGSDQCLDGRSPGSPLRVTWSSVIEENRHIM